MKKILFDLITSPFSIFENPICDYVVLAIIGYIAYKVAFGTVGDLGLRGEVGSIAHWIIRFFVFVFIWFICCVAITLITFIINNWIIITISAILLLVVYVLNIYANKNPESILNKKIF